jgi:nucleoside-diphosphate-sugar epimerase
LVTGGTGFVAGWCIVELLKRGHDVRATVRSAAKGEAVLRTVTGAVDPCGRLSCAVADLTSDEGWDDAVAGCAYVLHVASPMGGEDGANAEALIGPARDGTLRVLRAAVKAGVKRVVMTSSLAAAFPPKGKKDVNDESVWTDLKDETINPYRQSKVIAERAAWEFIQTNGGKTELTTILPGAVFGPILTNDSLGSVLVLGRMLGGKMPRFPRLGLSISDVRDLADIHILAMTAPAAAGERFIAIRDFMWMGEIASELRAKLGERAAKAPTKQAPDFVLKLAAIFDPAVRNLTPLLGRKNLYTSAKAQRVLGWAPRPGATTVVDCANSLIDRKVV